jgi:hypothetical protein
MAKKPDDWKRTWRRFPSFIVVLDSPRRREAACRHFIRPCKQKPQPNTRYLAGAKSYALWYPLWAPIFRPNAQGESTVANPLAVALTIALGMACWPLLPARWGRMLHGESRMATARRARVALVLNAILAETTVTG